MNPIEFTLTQSTTKTHDDAPDFTGEVPIGNSRYNAAVWFGEISKGKNIGRPYVGLQLTSQGNASQKINVSLWEKVKRSDAAEPHFKNREQINGQELQFSCWIEPAGELYQLRVLIEPAVAGDLSAAALETHQRLAEFVKVASARLPDTQQPELLPQPLESKSARPQLKDPDLDAEPDDLPF